MKLLMVLLALCGYAVAQERPTITMIGEASPSCQSAAYKVFYIEARVGVIPKHMVNVYCTEKAYEIALSKVPGRNVLNSPDGFSEIDGMPRITYLNAASVLRTTGDWRHHGDFLIAHEIGHFATDSAIESVADAWAINALKKYVPISYEDYLKAHPITF